MTKIDDNYLRKYCNLVKDHFDPILKRNLFKHGFGKVSM